jgi:class 3 adenylate cyclase/predicted ATPase
MTIHALGPFRLDTQANLLLRDGKPVALGRRAVALLRALLERPDALVTKDALIDAAWPGQVVEESNLTVQIAALRRVLGDVPGGERWIQTMSRRGYRLVVPTETVVEPIANAPAHPERRQITALCCELIGVSGRADGVGLEALRAAVGAFHGCIAQMAERQHGFIVNRLGNTALVLFGYPEAQEHDAERAVRAGLELCAAVAALRPLGGAPMQCRIGIATGMAIVGDLNAPGQQEIVGDAPNLAARLQLSASPGAVAIEAATRRLIGDLFECRPLGAIDANGGSEPAPSWQVTGESAAASRFAALRGAALAPLIGRDEEIGLLQRRWARAQAAEGQVVLVSGEPGIGKSRLVAALEALLRDAPHACLRYSCSPYRQDSALFPFIDQLGRAGAPAEDAILLADLMALPSAPGLSPRQRKARTLAALLRRIEALAQRQPVLMVLEDVHWLDATSGELLDLVVDRIRGLPVLLVLTFRPEFQPRWTGEPGVSVLALSRLDRRDRMALAAQIAGKTLPDAILEQIASRTDGVPLFVEELTKSVLENGHLRAEADRYVLDGALPAFAVPTSLYALLRARLDRPASARLVAQAGAAIGREFPYGLLRAVSPLPEGELRAALQHLVASELVFQRGTPPDAVYSFKHALVQDVAHDSLLQGPRQQLHARIAAALEAQSPELTEVQPEIVAQHYAEAGLAEKSAAAWSKAGRHSAARSALAEAAAQYRKALDQLARLPEGPARLRQELDCRSALATLLRFVKGQAAPETGDAYARARELWLQLKSPSGFLQVPYGYAMHHLFRGEVDVARRLAEDLLRLSAERQDAAGLVLGQSATGQCHLLAGGFAAARTHLEQVLALHEPASYAITVQQTGSHPRMTQAFLGNALLCLGYPEQAEARSNAAIAEARQLAHPTSVAVSLVIGALQLSLTGDSATLRVRAEELDAVATEQGLPAYRAWAAIYRGWGLVDQGDVTGGIALLGDGVAAYRATGGAMWMPRFVALLAAANALAGHLDRAAALLGDAVDDAQRTGERWYVAELHRQKARLLLRQRHAEAAEAQYRQALDVARAQHAKLWELRAATGLAQLLREQGRRGDAHQLLAPVHAWFTEGFALPDLRAARALLDDVGR